MISKLELKEQKVEMPSTTPFLELRLRNIVNGKPCSQRQLCKLMDNKISCGHMSSLERGRKPSLNELKTYHEYFGVSYEYLLGEESHVPVKNDSFYRMIKWLSTSKQPQEHNMWKVFVQLTTTESGLALLFYLSQYLSDNSLEESLSAKQLLTILEAWKKMEDKEYLSYQAIRQAFDNLLEKC